MGEELAAGGPFACIFLRGRLALATIPPSLSGWRTRRRCFGFEIAVGWVHATRVGRGPESGTRRATRRSGESLSSFGIGKRTGHLWRTKLDRSQQQVVREADSVSKGFATSVAIVCTFGPVCSLKFRQGLTLLLLLLLRSIDASVCFALWRGARIPLHDRRRPGHLFHRVVLFQSVMTLGLTCNTVHRKASHSASLFEFALTTAD